MDYDNICVTLRMHTLESTVDVLYSCGLHLKVDGQKQSIGIVTKTFNIKHYPVIKC